MRSRLSARAAVCLGLAIVAAAALFGAPSLLPAGVALVVVPGAAAGWVRLAAARARLLRFAPAGPLLEGRLYPLELRLEWGLLPPPGGELREPLLAEPLAVRPRSRRWRTEVAFPRRGRRSLGAAELVLADPFGLAERAVRSGNGGDLVVLPRTMPIELGVGGEGGRALGLGELGSGGAGPDSWAAEFEIDGLRPYRDGSPASRIHWPTVARTGELHERRITAGADAARLLVADPARPAGEAELDAAVRAAASICRELAAGGGCVLLIGGEGRSFAVDGPAGFREAHHRLAVLEADAGPPPLHRIARAGVVFWVSADPSPAPERRLARLAAGRRILVRPAAGAGGSGALFRVAGCEGRETGAGGGRGRRRRRAAA